MFLVSSTTIRFFLKNSLSTFSPWVEIFIKMKAIYLNLSKTGKVCRTSAMSCPRGITYRTLQGFSGLRNDSMASLIN